MWYENINTKEPSPCVPNISTINDEVVSIIVTGAKQWILFWGKVLMKFKYDISKDSLIIAHENKMLKEYIDYINNLKIINDFYLLCDKYNCSINIGLSWINEHNKKYSSYRVPVTKGYCCCVYFELQKPGSALCVKSYDGEADYYSMSASWIITVSSCSLFKKNKLYIELCSNEVDEECMEDICVLFELLSKADENDIFFTHNKRI